MERAARTVVLAANSIWNITNFRGGLIRGLREAGYAPVAIAPHDKGGVKRLAELGVPFEPLAFERSGLNPLADLVLQLRYRTILKRLSPVAFLGFTAKPNIYGTMAASSLGVPAIANVSGLGTAFMRRGALQRIVSCLYRIAFRRASTVFFHNPDDRRRFVERGIVRDGQARLLPGSGIDLDRFSPAPLPPGAPIFLLIARLLSDKGIREYVAAARMLRPHLPDARFQLLGGIDGENRSSIARAELDSWCEKGVIEYLGETSDVRPFIEKANAVVLPSYREGLPRSLLEGAAMGRPLIATDVPGCRELVEEGVNGFLCAARDPASLAPAMQRFATLSDERRATMGAESRRKVQEGFSENIVIRAYLDALGSLGSD
ncbi:MAG TPA: glycosyltransferase family 4 protein [Sphingomicrobium sp.]|nr:glycosyltransferase family 4 protein [Sphingomicrobium sp.]